MNEAPRWREALERFCGEIRSLYGNRLQEVMLYGSRARGDAQDDSDIDTLIILDPLGDFWTEMSRIGEVANRISLRYDVVISAIPVDVVEFGRPLTPLLIVAQQEGLPVE